MKDKPVHKEKIIAMSLMELLTTDYNYACNKIKLLLQM